MSVPGTVSPSDPSVLVSGTAGVRFSRLAMTWSVASSLMSDSPMFTGVVVPATTSRSMAPDEAPFSSAPQSNSTYRPSGLTD